MRQDMLVGPAPALVGDGAEGRASDGRMAVGILIPSPCLTAGQTFQTTGLSQLGKPLLDLLDMPHSHIQLSSCQQN